MDIARDTLFSKIDTSNDGNISLTEWNAAFSAADTDKGGNIDINEFKTYFGAAAEPAFKAIDKDGGGSIDSGEWTAFFTKAAGSDASLDKNELLTALNGTSTGGSNRLKSPCRGRTVRKCKRASKSCRSTRKTSKRRSYCRKSTRKSR
jgi:Ca2+-binding EF-hand superfamily protein